MNNMNKPLQRSGADQKNVPKLGAAATPPVVAPSFPIQKIVSPKCTVDVLDDGGADAIVQIDADVMKRITRRAGTMDLGQYLWENVFKKALESHVY